MSPQFILYKPTIIRHDNSKGVLAYSVNISTKQGASMKQLTLLTHRYSSLLENFANQTGNAKGITVRRGGLFAVKCQAARLDPPLIERIVTILTDIAQQENPVYQHSAKLQSMAGDLRGTKIFADIKKDLTRFLSRNNLLHLEGYMTFRMSAYREKLDYMSYSLIKKMKLTQRD